MIAVSLLLVASPPHADAATACVFAGSTATVSMSAAGDTASISVGTGANLGRIMVGAAACGAATTANTDTIVVTGNTGAETVTFDLSGGAFAPGLTAEGAGSSEIEVTVDLGTGVQDRVLITGGLGNETVTLGTLGIALNADTDVDVTLSGVELGTVNGSAGLDTISGAGDATTGAATTLQLTLNGDSGVDSLSGGDGDDTIAGGTGNNTLAGGAGDDTLTGGPDEDTLTGGPGGDTLTAGLGNDLFNEGAAADGSDTMAGGGGIDRITYAQRTAAVTATMDGTPDDGETGEGDNVGADVENATGGSGADTLTGAGGENELTGGPGGDRITGAAGDDRVFGGDDGDTIFEGAGNDALDGGSGSDTLDYSGVTAAITVSLASSAAQNTVGAGTDTIVSLENLVGGTGADTLGGDGNANAISGNSGNDTITGDGGSDAIDGDLGTDTVDYSSLSAPVTVVLAPATGLVPGSSTGAAGSDSLLGIENVEGGGGDDVLTGELGSNVLTGHGGNDTLAGLDGNDTLDGRAGLDTLDYSAAGSGVTVNLATAAAQVTLGAGSDTIASAENVTGSAFADTLTGTSIANTLAGGGDDDTLTGGLGADTLTGGQGIDTADYSAAGLGVNVDLSRTRPQSTGGAGTDSLSGVENLTGGAGRDTLRGNTNSNILSGGAGNDTLAGRGGRDLLDGGAGVDVVDYSSARRRVIVNLTTGFASVSGRRDTLVALESATGGRGSDLLIGDGAANLLRGGAGSDILQGLAGDDTMSGDAGRDRLAGQAGNDRLRGGPGADTADFSSFFSANLRVGVIVDLARGQAAGDGSDSLTAIENVVGSSFDDRLSGARSPNTLAGSAGNDVLVGRGGGDRLDGGPGTGRALCLGWACRHARRRLRARFRVARHPARPRGGHRAADDLELLRLSPETTPRAISRPVGESSARLRHDPDVRLRRLPAVRIGLLRVLVGDGAGDDHVVALLPVRRGRDLVVGGQLQRVDHAQHLVEVAARRHRIDEDQLDLLVRPDHEDVAHRLVVGRRPLERVARGLSGQHPVELRDVEVGVADRREVGRLSLRLLDVLRPAGMAVDRVDREPDHLDAPAVELGLDLRHVAELGRAHRRVVLRVRKHDRPGVADPVVEADPTLRRLRLEVRCRVANPQAHPSSSLFVLSPAWKIARRTGVTETGDAGVSPA